MFDFEKLEVYKKAKNLNNNLTSFIDSVKPEINAVLYRYIGKMQLKK
jgi:hypothetical protein